MSDDPTRSSSGRDDVWKGIGFLVLYSFISGVFVTIPGVRVVSGLLFWGLIITTVVFAARHNRPGLIKGLIIGCIRFTILTLTVRDNFFYQSISI